MSTHAGPNIIEDGLVLCLDAANEKSFRGEPTTNVVTNTDLDTGWSKSYNENILFNDCPPPEGVDSQVVSFEDKSTGGAYWFSYENFAPQESSTTYTISVYARTIGDDWGIRAYTADNSEAGRQGTPYIIVPGDGKWHRVVWDPITTIANNDSDSLSFQFSPMTVGQRSWLCAPQMEAKPYATPFVNGTRGSTVATGGGWADLSGNGNNGSLTSQIGGTKSLVFDGISSNILLPASSTMLPMPDMTWEIIFKSYGAYPGNPVGGLICLNYGMVSTLLSNGRLFFSIWDGNSLAMSTNSPTGVSYHNNWHHATFVLRGSVGEIYVDGNMVSSTTAVQVNRTGTNVWSGLQARIGDDPNDSLRDFYGEIGMAKIYNYGFSSSQVKQNFNALRGRYGI